MVTCVWCIGKERRVKETKKRIMMFHGEQSYWKGYHERLKRSKECGITNKIQQKLNKVGSRTDEEKILFFCVTP